MRRQYLVGLPNGGSPTYHILYNTCTSHSTAIDDAMTPTDRPEDDTAEETGQGLYPIRTLASVTGVNPVTPRAWERRYGLIQPHRAPKGHRLYSREQIRLVQYGVDLLGKGVSVGQVKAVLRQESEGGAEAASGIDVWAGGRRPCHGWRSAARVASPRYPGSDRTAS